MIINELHTSVIWKSYVKFISKKLIYRMIDDLLFLKNFEFQDPFRHLVTTMLERFANTSSKVKGTWFLITYSSWYNDPAFFLLYIIFSQTFKKPAWPANPIRKFKLQKNLLPFPYNCCQSLFESCQPFIK